MDENKIFTALTVSKYCILPVLLSAVISLGIKKCFLIFVCVFIVLKRVSGDDNSKVQCPEWIFVDTLGFLEAAITERSIDELPIKTYQ